MNQRSTSLRILLLLFLFLYCQYLFSQVTGKIEYSDCFLEDCSVLNKYPNIQFGYIYVPENYEKPEGKLLKIAFAIVKSRSSDPKSDAVIYFEGGWGAPTLYDLSFWANHFLGEERDIIFYDYRGSGYSEPRHCTSLGIETFRLIQDNLDAPEYNKKLIELYNACLNSLETAGIDFNQYGSGNKARDAVLLAEKLGYKSYNLFGISYGTRTIQSFLRYSKSDIRSVILDSNVPIGYPSVVGREIINFHSTLTRLFNDCAADTACN